MALTKKQAKEISELVNSVSLYCGLVYEKSAKENCDHAQVQQYMRWHDEACDDLINMGIMVNKFRP